MNFSIEKIDVIILDFDGVLTDNSVYLTQDGVEQVKCSRADGLAFDLLKKLKKPVYILSSEKNQVVQARALKLRVNAINNVGNKAIKLRNLADEEGFNLNNALYVGNDLNDYYAMKICGYTVCPSDSHLKIKEISDVVLKTPGGAGILREILEDIFCIDLIKVLYDSK